MLGGFARWRPKTLLAAWSVYWCGLVLWGLGSVLPAVWRLQAPGAKGSANVAFGDKGFELTMTEAGKTILHRGIAFDSLMLLIGLPPLILWALWLCAQRGRVANEAAAAQLGSGEHHVP